MSFLQQLLQKIGERLVNPTGESGLNPVTPEKMRVMNARAMEKEYAEAAGNEKPAENPYRSPVWDNVRKLNPQWYNEAVSGTKIASEGAENPSLLQQIMMDMMALEAGNLMGDADWIANGMRQLGGGPGRGPYQFEMPLPSDFNAQAQQAVPNFSATSATDSARVVRDQLDRQMLNRWGTPQDKNPLSHNWGTVDNPNNKNGSLVKLYRPEELNPLLQPQFRSEW